MAIIPLSQLMSVTSVGPTDLFILDQSGNTMKGTIAQLVANAKISTTADVQLTNLQTGQVLVYNANSGVWVNQNPVATFATLTDVDVSNAGTGKYLTYISSESKYGFSSVSFPFQIIQEATNTINGSSNTVTFSTATTSGNTLLAVISYAKDSGAFSLPSPWTQIMNQGETGSYSGMAIYMKAATGETSVTATGPSNGNTMRIFEIIGSRTVDKLNFTYSNVNVSYNVFPTLSPTVGAMVFVFAAFTSNGVNSVLIGSNYKEITNTNNSNASRELGGGILNTAFTSNFVPPQIFVGNYNGSTGPVLTSLSLL